MDNRFENFTITILKLNRLVQKIKLCEMDGYGLKAIHVMCIYYLYEKSSPLTASELVKLTSEDKAAVSRALSLLREKNYVGYDSNKYNSPISLTEEGVRVAEFINVKAERAVQAAGGRLSEEDRRIFYKSLALIEQDLKSYYESISPKGEHK